MKYYCDRCREWFDEDELNDENQYGDRECPRCGDDLIDEDLYEDRERLRLIIFWRSVCWSWYGKVGGDRI